MTTMKMISTLLLALLHRSLEVAELPKNKNFKTMRKTLELMEVLAAKIRKISSLSPRRSEPLEKRPNSLHHLRLLKGNLLTAAPTSQQQLMLMSNKRWSRVRWTSCSLPIHLPRGTSSSSTPQRQWKVERPIPFLVEAILSPTTL